MKYFSHILLLLTIAIGINACQSYDSPVGNPLDKKTIRSETKFDVDINNSNLSTILYSKTFDREGNLSEFNVYDPKGLLSTRSTYTYKDLQSNELRSNFNENGEVSLVDNIIYLFMSDGKVKEKQHIDKFGVLSSKEIFDYDLNGNLLKKTIFDQNSMVSLSTEYSYKYNNSGALVERISNETGVFGSVRLRDSISYVQTDNKLEIFNYNSSGAISRIKTIFYNQNGLVSLETESDKNGKLLSKFAYRYEYFD